MTSLQRTLNWCHLPIFIAGVFIFLLTIGLLSVAASSVRAEFATLPAVIEGVTPSPAGVAAAFEPTATRPAPPVTATPQPAPTATAVSPSQPGSDSATPVASPTVTPTATLVPFLPMSGDTGMLKIQFLLVVFFCGCILLGLAFGVRTLKHHK